VPWRPADLDSLVIWTLAQHPLLSCSELVETIDEAMWERVGKGNYDRAPQLAYQSLLQRLHRLKFERRIIDADRRGNKGSMRWRVVSAEEVRDLIEKTRREYECPPELRKRIERAAAALEGQVEFHVVVHERVRPWEDAYADLVVRLPRGTIDAEVKDPGREGGAAWAKAAAECGLSL